jgi:S-formylglutathione hydrolase FrmB
MDYPDIFGAAYAMAPCCLQVSDDLSRSNDSWQKLDRLRSLPMLVGELRQGKDMYPISFVALAAALSPNPAAPSLYVDLPFGTQNGAIVEVPAVLDRWKQAMPVARVADAAGALRSLRMLWLDYGYDDRFTHIPAGTRAFADALSRHRIPYVLESHAGNHNNLLWERLASRVLPLVSAVFGF